MLETLCLINGRPLRVKYRKQFEEGEAFKGIIFLKSAIPFYCHALNENLVLFEPQSLDQSLKDAIFKAIKKDQSLKKKNSY